MSFCQYFKKKLDHKFPNYSTKGEESSHRDDILNTDFRTVQKYQKTEKWRNIEKNVLIKNQQISSSQKFSRRPERRLLREFRDCGTQTDQKNHHKLNSPKSQNSFKNSSSQASRSLHNTQKASSLLQYDNQRSLIDDFFRKEINLKFDNLIHNVVLSSRLLGSKALQLGEEEPEPKNSNENFHSQTSTNRLIDHPSGPLESQVRGEMKGETEEFFKNSLRSQMGSIRVKTNIEQKLAIIFEDLRSLKHEVLLMREGILELSTQYDERSLELLRVKKQLNSMLERDFEDVFRIYEQRIESLEKRALEYDYPTHALTETQFLVNSKILRENGGRGVRDRSGFPGEHGEAKGLDLGVFDQKMGELRKENFRLRKKVKGFEKDQNRVLKNERLIKLYRKIVKIVEKDLVRAGNRTDRDSEVIERLRAVTKILKFDTKRSNNLSKGSAFRSKPA